MEKTACGSQEDGRLLAEFASTGSGAAFETLVRRHTRLVVGVCRRVLRDADQAEDAAQAVFLLLAHRARSLQRRSSIAGWLHEAAWSASRNAARVVARRRNRELEAGRMGLKRDDSRDSWEELQPILDRELRALPEKYRSALILHYLEGRSYEESSRASGCGMSAFMQRMNRAREMLRDRLARQGVAIPSALIFAVIAEKTGECAVSATFVASTVQAAGSVASGKTFTGIVSAGVEGMVERGLKAMVIAKMKAAAAAIALSAAAGAAGVAAVLPGAPPAVSQESASKGIAPGEFEKLHALIKPQPDEWKWARLPWMTDWTAARKKAAKEGKPLYVFKMAGEPLGQN